MINERQNNDTRDRVYGFISANYNFTEWLSLNVRAGTDTYMDQRFMRAAIHDPGDRDGRVENRSYRVQEYNYDFLLNANHDFGPDFSGSLSFGGNYMSSSSEETGNIGTQLNIPGLYHINNANSVTNIYNRSEEHTSELQSRGHLVCRLLLEKKK